MARLLALLAAPLGSAALPSTMRAGAVTKMPLDFQVHLEDFHEIEVAVPHPAAGEVLVQVAGASVNPVEWKVLELPIALSYHYPRIAGYDVSGTVVAVGEGASRFKVGDQVWALSPNEGGHAEYVAVPEVHVGAAPSGLELPLAGTLPLAALTNLQAFRIARGPWSGRNLTAVVLGGSGGTGHTAVQMARAWGATRVVTTCSTQNLEFCQSLGADVVVDYHKYEWQKIVEPESVDLVYDTVALNGTGDIAYPTLKDGGFFITLLPQGLASASVASQRPSITQQFFLLNQTSTEDLDALRTFVDGGHLKPHIDATFGLGDIAQVFNASMQGHTVGKLLVLPSQGKGTAVLV